MASRRGSGRRSVVVVAVTVAAAVGGAVAGGKLGRKAGSAAGTRLREKMQHRVTRPERLDSVVGYAEQGGQLLGSVVGGTAAALAALSLADRFLGRDEAGVLEPPQLLIGGSAPFPSDLPSLVHPHSNRPTEWAPPNTSHPLVCEEMWSRCQQDVINWSRERLIFCQRSASRWEADACWHRVMDNFDSQIEACREAFDCISGCSQSPIAPYGVRCCYGGKQACGTGVVPDCVDLKTDAQNCGTCGHACPATMTCINGACDCPPGKFKCTMQGFPSVCCSMTGIGEYCASCDQPGGTPGPPICIPNGTAYSSVCP